jgi:protein-L-isoaspartate(D-aspartate) O-methyltransferase
MDYASLRRKMIEEQLLLREIRDSRVIAAFSKVERHKFVPEESLGSAYADFPLSIGKGQTISQPYIVALMTECLGLSGSERVLEIGTGSGYQAAILGELAKEVYTIERIASLAEKAEALLRQLGYRNISVRNTDGSLGWPEAAPFERIIITAATSQIPLPLQEQLREGGRLILPLGGSFSQSLTLAEKKNNLLQLREVCGCVFVPLLAGVDRQQVA